MRLLIDVNVLLDVFQKRQPWGGEAALLLTAVEEGRAAGFIATHTVTTAHYVIARTEGARAAATAVSDLLRLVEVVPVEKTDLQHALALGARDFEDAVQQVCAQKVSADAIVTRDADGFAGCPIRVLGPASALHLLGRGG
jgi:predicted nucleic acid-binding protein